MTDIGVTMHARHRFFGRLGRQHVVDKVGMTMQTRILCRSSIPRFDSERIGIVVEGECERVEESVISLGHPFSDRIV